MTPRERVKELYQKYPQNGTFERHELLHRETGYVIEGDDYFLMGRPVSRAAPLEEILDPSVAFFRTMSDAWFIWVYVGPARWVLELAPYKLPYVGWVRRHGGVKWYECEDFRRFYGSGRDTKIFGRTTSVKGK